MTTKPTPPSVTLTGQQDSAVRVEWDHARRASSTCPHAQTIDGIYRVEMSTADESSQTDIPTRRCDHCHAYLDLPRTIPLGFSLPGGRAVRIRYRDAFLAETPKPLPWWRRTWARITGDRP